MASSRAAHFSGLVAVLMVAACSSAVPEADTQPPNIVVFYADDLGYGDLGSYGATRVRTPHVDRLAARGIRFTDAHATSAICTPSRYSLLTGEYGFRRNAAILTGDAPALIQPGKPTLPSMLQSEGYTTAVIGKWHLGLGHGSVDWNADIAPGPLDIGFDYAFLLPATGDRVPTVYVENRRVVGLDPEDPIAVNYTEPVSDRPTGNTQPELLRYGADTQHSDTIVNGISRIGHMAGGAAALWVDEDFPDMFGRKAVDFIRRNKERPFFLFYSFHDPHVPRLPHPRFQGVSELGLRGDAIVQMDAMVGEVIDELARLGLEDNTVVVFSSDNGPVLNDGYDDGAVESNGDHDMNGGLRGGKYSLLEAGARVPLIWAGPGVAKPGDSTALISQVDLYASFAALSGHVLEPTEAIDSENQLEALQGHDDTGRDWLFKEGFTSHSLRKRDVKFIPGQGQASAPPFIARDKGIESGWSADPQLYNLASDRAERVNIASDNPGLVEEMEHEMQRIFDRAERRP